MAKIKLGDRVKDNITGFQGIVTAKTDWKNGCTRFGIQSEKLHDGKPIEVEWFDEDQCSIVLEDAAPNGKREERRGGPRQDPRF
jgi:hypothetical protein